MLSPDHRGDEKSSSRAIAPSIRPARGDDAPALGVLHVRAWQWAYRGLLPDAYLDDLPRQTAQREEMWRQQTRAPSADRAIWVAERGDQIVGFCSTARMPDVESHTAELLAIYLDPDVVGTGVGAALMRHALDALRQQGCRSVTLWVLDTNARARRFYEKGGWRPDGTARTDDVWGIAVQEVRYRISLDSWLPVQAGA